MPQNAVGFCVWNGMHNDQHPRWCAGGRLRLRRDSKAVLLPPYLQTLRLSSSSLPCRTWKPTPTPWLVANPWSHGTWSWTRCGQTWVRCRGSGAGCWGGAGVPSGLRLILWTRVPWAGAALARGCVRVGCLGGWGCLGGCPLARCLGRRGAAAGAGTHSCPISTWLLGLLKLEACLFCHITAVYTEPAGACGNALAGVLLCCCRPPTDYCHGLPTACLVLAGLLGFPSKDLQFRFLCRFRPVFYIRQRDYRWGGCSSCRFRDWAVWWLGC